MPHQCTNCERTFADGSKEMLSGCPDCGGNKFQFAPAGATIADSSGGDASTASSADAGPTGATGADGADAGGSRATKAVRSWVSEVADSVTGDSAPHDSRTGEAGGADDTESGSFAEWPDSARPPAERSSAADSAADSSASTDAPAETATGSSPPDPAPVPDEAALTGSEDTAQADARSEVVSREDLPSAGRSTPGEAPSSDEASPADVESRRAGAESGAGAPASPEAGDAGPVAPENRPEHGRVVSEPTGDRPSLEELREELNDQFESIKIVRPGEYELNLMELYDREEYIVSLQEDGRYVIDVPDSWHDED